MDKRLVKDSKPFTKTDKVTPIEYTHMNGRSFLGVVSQELEAIDQRLVKKTVQGYIIPDYEALTVFLMAKVNQLEEQVKSLQNAKVKVTVKDVETVIKRWRKKA